MKLYNTATKSIQEFKPLNDKTVTLYTCGPTVYSEPHIGNWIAYLRWDLLVRVLQTNGYSVNRVMNITDVGHLTSDSDEGEDKMEKGARREGVTAWDIAKRYTASFNEGFCNLNLVPTTRTIPATDYIKEQIALIEVLEKKGHTYVINDGVYFDTSTFPDYGSFAQLDLTSQKAGARVGANPEKHNPSDFALWKFSPKDKKRDMEWESPWGAGFPGWHIECSAIALGTLGKTIDIHTGGIDHIPIHHTNEIAQSEAATGQRFANYWLHANFLLSNGTKISKSLENGYTLKDLTDRQYDLMAFKMLALQSHYRSELNFTWENLQAAQNRLSRWRQIAEMRWQIHDTLVDDDTKDNRYDANGPILAAKRAVMEHLNNDLNSPEALVSIETAFDMIESSNSTLIQKSALNDLLEFIDQIFGLSLIESTPDVDNNTKHTLLNRQRSRENKDWAQSDVLREELASQGIYLKDTGTRTLWSRYQ